LAAGRDRDLELAGGADRLGAFLRLFSGLRDS